MSRILGLDLGTNSIGWAITNDNKIESLGVRIFPNTVRVRQRNKTPQKANFLLSQLTNSLTFVKRNTKSIVLLTITITMFLLGFLFPTNWQFWINLGIGCLIATLTFSKK